MATISKIAGIAIGTIAKLGGIVRSSISQIVEQVRATWNDKSIDFDGTNDYLLSSANLDINVQNRRTKSISFWFKTSSISSSPHYFISFGSNSLSILANSNNLKLQHNTIFPDFEIHWSHRSSWLNTGTWVNIIYTVSCPAGQNTEATHKIYIDAVLKQTTAATRNQGDYPAGKMSVGASTSGTYPLQTIIDEIGWWDDVVLDADAVTALYNNGVPIDLSTDSGDYDNSSSLVHWWRMGDGDTYPTIEDNAGSLDLTMTNMVAGDIVTNIPT